MSFNPLIPSRLGMHSAVMICLLAGVVGCGEGTVRKVEGTITGSVTFNGQPVTEGDVNFIAKETGVAAKAPLDSSGKYTLPAIEIGTYKVFVTPPPLAPPQEGVKVQIKTYNNIPDKYRDETQTPESIDVVEGMNEKNIDMKQ